MKYIKKLSHSNWFGYYNKVNIPIGLWFLKAEIEEDIEPRFTIDKKIVLYRCHIANYKNSAIIRL